MATSKLAYAVEKVIGHDDSAVTQQDVSNYNETGDPEHTMKALTWQGKNKVQMLDLPRPKILEPRDVILKVTGSTICGSDLHLYHGSVVQMQVNDILGHEFCGIVDEVGPEVKGIKKGGRYVASFQIACGEVGHTKDAEEVDPCLSTANRLSASSVNRNSRHSASAPTPTAARRRFSARRRPASLATRT